MPSPKKQKLVQDYRDLIEKYPNYIFTRFSGLDVGEMTQLRSELRKEGVEYRVVKNNIFKLALKDREDVEVPDDVFAGPIGVVFAGEQTPKAAKSLEDLQKELEQIQIFSAVLDAEYFNEERAKAISKLPTREEILGTLARALNGPATDIAGLMQNIMASLARAIKAVGEKNG